MTVRNVAKNYTFEQQRLEINDIGADNGDFSGKVIGQAVVNNLIAQTITDCLLELDTELGPIASITGEIPLTIKITWLKQLIISLILSVNRYPS